MLLLNPSQKFLRKPRPHDRVERGEGLVHEQQFWLQDKNLSNRDALFLASRQLVGKTIAETLKPKSLQPNVGFGECRIFRSLADAKAQRDVFSRAPPGEEGIVLKQKPEGILTPVQLHTPAAWREQTGDGAQDAGLAGPRRSHETYEFASGNFKADAFDDGFLSVTQGEI